MAEERAEVKINKKSLKRQLLGAFVLTAALIVLFPVLFDGSGRIPVKKVTDIPPVIKSKPFELVQIETPDMTWTDNDLVVDVEAVDFADGTGQVSGEVTTDSNIQNTENTVEVEKNNKTAQNSTTELASKAVLSHSATQESELKTGWSIQLGSFKNEKNAQTLLSDLKTSGFSAWIQHRAASDNSTLSQVFAGPWVHEAQARAINKELSEKFNVSGMVLRPR